MLLLYVYTWEEQPQTKRNEEEGKTEHNGIFLAARDIQ